MASQTFTSWKLDLLNAAGMDERLKPVSVRLLLRLVEGLSEDTWEKDARTCAARIGDDVIADEIPGLKDRQTIRDHRKALAAAGWLTFEPGHGRRATVYTLTDSPVNALLDRRDELREARKTRREMERLARAVSLAEGGKRPRISEVGGGQTSPSVEALHPPVHLSGSPSPLALPVQNEALPAHDPDTGEIIPSTTSSPFICTECGEPAVIPCRETGEAYCARHAPSWLRAGIDYRRLSEGE